RAAVLLPPHWQTAAVLLGTWSLGVSVSIRLAATAGLPVVVPGTSVVAVTAADGSYVLARVPAGERVVQVTGRSGAVARSAPVPVSRGARLEIPDLVLQE
ncbi:MAG: hypothetical protein ACK4N5_27125, partial [Myxococcales bacterium]